MLRARGEKLSYVCVLYIYIYIYVHLFIYLFIFLKNPLTGVNVDVEDDTSLDGERDGVRVLAPDRLRLRGAAAHRTRGGQQQHKRVCVGPLPSLRSLLGLSLLVEVMCGGRLTHES